MKQETPRPVETSQLVKEAQGGDRTAVDELISRYLEFVRSVIALRMRRPRDSLGEFEDVVQETLVRVFKNIDKFEYRSESSFRNWLAACATASLTDHHRRQTAEKRGGGKVRLVSECGSDTLSSAIFAGDVPTPSDIAQAQESRLRAEGRLEQALHRLQDHYLEVIILRKLCNMPYSDIAETMGYKREHNARLLFSRAMLKLKRTLEADQDSAKTTR